MAVLVDYIPWGINYLIKTWYQKKGLVHSWNKQLDFHLKSIGDLIPELWSFILAARDATIYQYIVYHIALSLYWCIDTKSNHIDISRIVIYRRIVACFNEIIVHCGQLKWYMMLFKEKKHHLFLLKATQNNVLTIEQYIAVSWYIRGNISIRLHTVSLQLY